MDYDREPLWQTPKTDQLAVPSDGAHLWEMTASHDLAGYLGEAEMERYLGITNEDAKISFATSQGGLRSVAALYLGREPGAIVVDRAERGKPFIKSGPEFNISHTAGRIFAAFAAGPVGLDVESTQRLTSATALARKFFATRETEHLMSFAEGERNRVFLRYWVCKEATVKLAGDGIYLGLRDAHVTLEADGSARGEYRGRGVWLQTFCPGRNLMGALAAWQPTEVKCFFRI